MTRIAMRVFSFSGQPWTNGRTNPESSRSDPQNRNTMTDERYRALERRYFRLLAAAENLIRDTRSIGSPEAPACAVPPHRIKTLRREVQGEPQPSALATMGPT
jgi:hypothetical protein